MRVYLDSCCYNRPFDMPRTDRIALEAEAVMRIISRADSGKWELVWSELLDFELSRIPRVDDRIAALSLLSIASVRAESDETVREFARSLNAFGLRQLDAYHLALAKAAGADIFLSVDDRLVSASRRVLDQGLPTVENPAVWLLELDREGG